MSSAGTSGTNDTERGNSLNGQPNAGGMSSAGMSSLGDASDDTVEVIEVIEVDEPGLTSDNTLAFEQDTLDRALMDTGFPWWYVPAVGLPVVVGAGAAIWYLTKGPQSFLDAYDLVSGRNKPAQARSTLRQSVQAARESAKNLPDQTEDLRERLADAWDDARDSVLDWWDTMTDRDTLEQVRGRANDAAGTAKGQLAKVAAGVAAAGASAAAKQKTGDFADTARARAAAARDRAQDKAREVRGGGFDLGDWLGGLGAVGGAWMAKNQSQDLKDKAKDRASGLRDQAKAQLRDANVKSTIAKVGGKSALSATKAAAPVAAKAVATKAKTEHAVKKTGRKVNRFWKETRAFTFGMLVTATVTYIRMWRSRLDEKNLRETAGGRMVRDA